MCLSSGRPFVQAGLFIVCFSSVYISSLAGGKKPACTNGLPDDKHMI